MLVYHIIGRYYFIFIYLRISQIFMSCTHIYIYIRLISISNIYLSLYIIYINNSLDLEIEMTLLYKSSMKKLQSMSDIKDYLSGTARISKTYGKYVATYVSIFTMLMKTCKGRDKICSFIQYGADFYYHCNKYSEIQQIQQSFKLGTNRGAIVALKLRNSMKNSRKIFKFLKFIDQIVSIIKKLQSKKPMYMKVVGILQNIMACIAGVFDNIIWGINIEVLDYWFAEKYKYFKANKYFFSLCKVIFKMLGSNFQHHHRIKNMKQIVLKLRQHKDDLISPANQTLQLAKQYLKQRRQVRIQQLDGAISICRIIMLIRSLKLPGYTYVTKILYSSMGLLSTFLSVLQMIFEQPILVEIQKIDTSRKQQIEDYANAKRVKIGRSGTLSFI